jgi:hypothetical protein
MRLRSDKRVSKVPDEIETSGETYVSSRMIGRWVAWSMGMGMTAAPAPGVKLVSAMVEAMMREGIKTMMRCVGVESCGEY